MSMSNAAELNALKLIFLNTTWAGIGDTTGIVGSTAAGNLYVGFHTGDPGEAGTQATSEIAYTGYARVPVPRTSSGWEVSANGIQNKAQIVFGKRTNSGADVTATHFTVGKAASGTGEILVSGELTSPITIVETSIPYIDPGELDITGE